MPAYKHGDMEQDIWHNKGKFAKLAEEPHMSRSEQAGFMNARIAQLEQVIVTKSGALVTLKCKHKSVKLILQI